MILYHSILLRIKNLISRISDNTHEDNIDLLSRRFRWLFSKSGVVSLAFEHFLAMVPATLIVPILVNNTLQANIIDVSLVLFASGIGTIMFTILSQGKIPAYLGSSFAYIGLTIYLLKERGKELGSFESAYIYVGWAYIFSGVLLVLLSLLYKKRGIDKILTFLLPASVIGPAISLIGLELADTAVVDSGFDLSNGLVSPRSAIISIVTLFIIVLFSLIKHKVWKNAAIIIGMLAGYIVYLFIYGLPTIDFDEITWLQIPKFHIPLTIFPSNALGLLIAVVPATFIVFTENIGRVTVINRMINNDKYESTIFNAYSVKALMSGLFSHGIASVTVSFLGSVPNTIYAENIAVMGIHKTDIKREDPDSFIQKLVQPFSYVPYIIASLIAILFSFIGFLQELLINIPKPVIGGMELFLFGIISAPGIQLLVEQRVNYKKISNQIITASVLISGVSGLSVNLGLVELKGMSLGFVIGVILNLIVQLLKWLGNLSDSIVFDEFATSCISEISAKKREMRVIEMYSSSINDTITSSNANIDIIDFRLIPINILSEALQGNIPYVKIKNYDISSDLIKDMIKHSSRIAISYDNDAFDNPKIIIILRETANGIFIDFLKEKLTDKTITMFLNDYPESIDADDIYLCLNVTQNIPIRKINKLIKDVLL